MPTIDVQPPLNDEYIAEVKDCAGVVYPHGFLDRTRCIEPFSGLSDTLAAPAEPIRVINTQDFASLHAEHLLSHAPDSVLFPFLHGIEGDNIAQNTFFRNSAGHRKLSVNSEGRFVAAVPKYRGLLWVLCDEDLADAPRHHREQVTALLARNRSAGSFSEEDSDEDMTYSDDEFDTEEDEDMPQSALSDTASAMALDIDVHQDSEGFQDMEVNSKDKDTPSHMHPVAHRLGLQTDSLANGIHSPDEMSATSTMPDLDTSLDPSSPTDSVPATPDADIAPIASCSPKRRQFGESKSQNPPPPVLTGTFLPSDIIRCSGEKDYEWEFLPLRVPDGISLRNFGIQVPIYSTLSDIVIYSPNGVTPNAEKLARRIEVAQRKQRTERAKRLGLDLTSPHSGMYDGVVNDMDVGPSPSALHDDELLQYRTFILDGSASSVRSEIPHLVIQMRSGQGVGASTSASAPDTDSDLVETQRREEHDHGNTVDFAVREREEMRDLTRASEILSIVASDDPTEASVSSTTSVSRTMAFALAAPPSSVPPSAASLPFTITNQYSKTTTNTHWQPNAGQVFLGNTSDVPMPSSIAPPPTRNSSTPNTYVVPFIDETHPLPEGSPLSPYPDNLPGDGLGYDICIECHEGVANFPTPAQMRAAEEHLGRLEAMWVDHCVAGREREYGAKSEDKGDGDGFWTVPPRPPPNADNVIHIPFPSSPPSTVAGCKSMIDVLRWIERWLRPVKSVRIPLPEPDNSEEDIVVGPSDPASSPGHARRWSAVSSLFPSFINGTPQQASRARSFTSPDPPPVGLQHNRPSPSHHPRFSSPTRPIKLLLYSSDGYTESSIPALTLLMCAKKLSLPEAYLELQVEKRRSFFVFGSEVSGLRGLESLIKNGEQQQQRQAPIRATGMGRPAAKSISFAQPVPTPPKTAPPIEDPANSPTPTISEVTTPVPTPTPYRRPRATTSPATMFGMNHQAWFDDPRFDGSFPSRILPFLYLGNLNHASNVYMLHALGITHVVSVGESALAPPANYLHSANYNMMSSSSSVPTSSGFPHHLANQASLYLEEKEGRIKVLDIKGVSDDGIDTLEPQLEPICEWIDEARRSGGQVLVHCRVGVSRSATVVIAYVMKHLNLPLVDSYLVVRSRRLSVLIQPNMRLLYNLCGWEIRLAKARAKGDEELLKKELGRALCWPYLAKEVYSLNEKYLH